MHFNGRVQGVSMWLVGYSMCLLQSCSLVARVFKAIDTQLGMGFEWFLALGGC